MKNKMLIIIFLVLLAASFLTGCCSTAEETTTPQVPPESESAQDATTVEETEDNTGETTEAAAETEDDTGETTEAAAETEDYTREATEAEKKAIEEAIPDIIDQKVMQYSGYMDITKHLTDNDGLVKNVEVMETEMETKSIGSYGITYKVTVYKDRLAGDEDSAAQEERETEAVLVKETVKVVTEAEADRLVKKGVPVIYPLGRVHFPKQDDNDEEGGAGRAESETGGTISGLIENTQPIGATLPETSLEETQPETSPTETSSEETQPETRPAANTPTQSPSHTHDWKPVTKVVHHDAVYTTKWVVDKEAWGEQVVAREAWDEEITEERREYHKFCSECGFDFTAAGYSNGAAWDHCLEHVESYPNATCGYYTDSITVTYTTVKHHDAEYKMVHHEATGHNEDELEKAAYDETVTTGYKCSCGATK